MTRFPGWYERFRHDLSRRPFRPHWVIPGAHGQTLAGARLPRRFPWGWTGSSQELVELEDGVGVRTEEILEFPKAPTVIVIHGMTGCNRSGYSQGFSNKAWRRGWNTILPSLYNVSPAVDRPRFFHAGSSDMVSDLLLRLVEDRGLERVFLVGVSMGGNILLKLMGEWGEDRPDWLLASAVMSPLCDLTQSWQRLEDSQNRIYQTYFMNRLRKIVFEHHDAEKWIDSEALQRARTIRQFDELVTAPLCGYRDAMHYYRRCSSLPLLERIQAPTFVLHSKDDLFLPWEPFVGGAASNPNLLIHLSDRGGHVGFFESDSGRDLDRRWAENRILEFFDSFLRCHE